MAESRGADEKTNQDCWKIMTFSEKVLLFLLIFTVLLLIAAIVFIGFLLLYEPDVCESPTCIAASANLLEVADFAADPCADLYSFACGNHVPLQKDCEEAIEPRKAVLSAPTEDSDSESLKAAKSFYEACINVDESSGVQALEALIYDIGGWQIFHQKNWNENDFHWLKFIAQQLRPRGIENDWFLQFDYYVDSDGTNLLLIGPPDPEKISRRHHIKRIESMTVAAGKFSDNYILDDLSKIEKFQDQLKSIATKALQVPNTTRMTVQELNKLWPEIQLVDVLNKLTNGLATFTNLTNVEVNNYYVYELNLLLRNTNSRTQLNYLIWKIVESYLLFISEKFREYYDKSLQEDHCFDETIKRFYSAIESNMINNNDNGVIRSVHSMTSRIMKAVREDAEDPQVVIAGLQGENSGVTNVHFRPDNIVNMINAINSYVEDEFYTCLLKLSTSCDRETYFHSSGDPEIRFDADQMTVYLSSSLLRSDMYEWDQPNFIKYSRLGWNIATAIIETLRRERRFYNKMQGVDLAYEAYIIATQEGGMDGTLPAVDYNVKQLFWIHACSLYCNSEHNSTQFEEVKNSEYFKKDFQCP